MRVAGERSDGALLVYLDGGMAVILKGANSSKALDLSEADKLGPWTEADNSLSARLAAAKRIDAARVVPVSALHLDNPGGVNQYGGPYSGAGGDGSAHNPASSNYSGESSPDAALVAGQWSSGRGSNSNAAYGVASSVLGSSMKSTGVDKDTGRQRYTWHKDGGYADTKLKAIDTKLTSAGFKQTGQSPGEALYYHESGSTARVDSYYGGSSDMNKFSAEILIHPDHVKK